jgi:hypothetical protein
MLIINEPKCRCFSTFNLYYNFTQGYIGHKIILFPHLLSSNRKCTHPCYPPCYSNCCSEDKEELEYFDKEFYACAALIICLWSCGVFRCRALRESILAFVKDIVHIIIILYL